jgi:hypothetical protein
LPPPTLCPTCREIRRFVFRNERCVYRRTCDLCKASIISIYSPEKPCTVYCPKCWWGDNWDAQSFGRDFDFGKPFFEQFGELLNAVPRCSIYNVNGTNSDYCQQCVDNKDCYLSFVMKGCESGLYLFHVLNDKDCADSAYLRESELCYECLDSHNLYSCAFCENCANSSDCKFCYDVSNCQDCFGCIGLRNKKYHIFNEPVSKDEYEKRISELKLDTFSGVEAAKKRFDEFKLKFPHRNLRTVNTENSDGDNIQNMKNCHACFDGWDLQDCAYSTFVFNGKDYVDCYGMGDSEMVYEAIGDEEVNRCAVNTFVTRSSDVGYSDSCFSSANLFGCVGLKNAKFCLFNKQYDKGSFDKLRMTIIEHMKKTGEWGEFFPANLSPFNYNETIAQDNFPRDWKDENKTEYAPQTCKIPDSVKEAADSIPNEILACEVTGKNFKIIPQELAFYRKLGLPIPRKCPDQRHRERMAKRNPRKIFERNCAKCAAKMKTTYAPERSEIVYCEHCYLESVY